MVIATSRYQSTGLILASGLAPVRTSLGYPRFRLGYRPVDACRELTPTRSLRALSEGFSEAYRARLDEFGPELIRRRLEAIVAQAGASGVVLLCFEDVLGRGEYCHRRDFAAWWEARTGEPVLELMLP